MRNPILAGLFFGVFEAKKVERKRSTSRGSCNNLRCGNKIQQIAFDNGYKAERFAPQHPDLLSLESKCSCKKEAL
jgi:hypothetical protein